MSAAAGFPRSWSRKPQCTAVACSARFGTAGRNAPTTAPSLQLATTASETGDDDSDVARRVTRVLREEADGLVRRSET